MANLGDIMGAVLTGLAHARRQADETAALLAEYYRTSPLLEGMAAPRFRIPELTMDIPVIIDNFEEAEPSKFDAQVMTNRLMDTVRSRAPEMGLRVTRDSSTKIKAEIKRSMANMEAAGVRPTPEALLRVVGEAIKSGVTDRSIMQEVDVRKVLSEDLRALALEAGLISPGRLPRLNTTVVTEQVRQLPPERVARIRLRVSEEGVEWTPIERADGTVVHTLTPE